MLSRRFAGWFVIAVCFMLMMNTFIVNQQSAMQMNRCRHLVPL